MGDPLQEATRVVAETRGPRPVIATLTPDMVVVITGATSGIGEWLAKVHARDGGCKLVLAGRRQAELDRVCAECRALNPQCIAVAVPTDVTKTADCQALIQAAVASSGESPAYISRIYLNAGVSQSSTFEESGPSQLQEIFGVNFFGAAEVLHAALPYLRGGGEGAPGGGSRIGVISSVLGLLVAPYQTGYVASKWAMHGFFESLRCELEPRAITVTMVCPGPVNTPFMDTVDFNVGEEQRGRMMTAERAAALAVEAVEDGTRCVVYGRTLAGLVDLRASDPAYVDSVMSQQYAPEPKGRGVKERRARL